MVGILIVTHGKLAAGFEDSVNMIMGKQEQFHAMGLFPNSDLEHFKDVVMHHMRALDSGDGILVFVDMFGASPSNFAASNISELLNEGKKVRVITGVNLGMLIESVSMRSFTETLDELYRSALMTGKDGIKELLETLASQEDEEDD